MVSGAVAREGSAEAVGAAEVANMRRVFDRQASFLFTILSGVHSHQSSPHLAQLLLRVDYNGFFSQSASVGLAKSGQRIVR